MGKYKIIYADPPWNYGNTKNPDGWWGRTEKHYPAMKLEDIKNLSVPKLCANDCYLFLWTTSPFMEKSFEILKAWGFKYSTIPFVWVKMTNDMKKPRGDGLGKYTPSNAEYVLLGRKGKYWRDSTKIKQIVLAPKGKHSKKPKEVRDRILDLCGDLPRIELFARNKTDGWDVWGNEVESEITLNVCKKR